MLGNLSGRDSSDAYEAGDYLLLSSLNVPGRRKGTAWANREPLVVELGAMR